MTIKQSELRAAVAARRELERLEASEAVQQYLGARKTVEALHGALKARRAEGVQPGKLALIVKTSAAVAWEKVLTALRGVPGVGEALAAPAAARILRQAQERDTKAAFVSERVSVEVVAAE
jgi:C4-dicarboxylate-specific signal transduction histidine kinase